MTFNHILSLNFSKIFPNPISYSFYFWKTKGTTTATTITQKHPKREQNNVRKFKLVLFWPIIFEHAACRGLWLTCSVSLHWSVWFSLSQCYQFANSFFGGDDAPCLSPIICARVLCGLPLCRACVCFHIICKFIHVTVLFYVGKNFFRVIHQVWLLQAAASSSQISEAWEKRKATESKVWVSAPESLSLLECCPVEGLCENSHLQQETPSLMGVSESFSWVSAKCHDCRVPG